jgi:hypothetical protein
LYDRENETYGPAFMDEGTDLKKGTETLECMKKSKETA